MQVYCNHIDFSLMFTSAFSFKDMFDFCFYTNWETRRLIFMFFFSIIKNYNNVFWNVWSVVRVSFFLFKIVANHILDKKQKILEIERISYLNKINADTQTEIKVSNDVQRHQL